MIKCLGSVPKFIHQPSTKAVQRYDDLSWWQQSCTCVHLLAGAPVLYQGTTHKRDIGLVLVYNFGFGLRLFWRTIYRIGVTWVVFASISVPKFIRQPYIWHCTVVQHMMMATGCTGVHFLASAQDLYQQAPYTMILLIRRAWSPFLSTLVNPL